MWTVSIIIPTLNRPTALSRALKSVFGQSLPDDITVEVIVIDNSSSGSARDVVLAHARSPAVPITYVHEPQLGVASARNRGVRTARGCWIAFLDDDEEASKTWIASFVDIARSTGADAVFGPVHGKADGVDDVDGFAPYFSRRIRCPDPDDITHLSAYLGTNNSLFNRKRCLDEPFPFNTNLNHCGGEDSLLLQRLMQRGYRFAWAAKAEVVEWVPAGRLSWRYIRTRTLLSGQIRVAVLHMLRPVHWTSIAFWMGVGLLQLVGGGMAMLVLRPFNERLCARASVVCYSGLGKLLWMRRFRPTLYGPGLVS